eukprot:4439075-Amphidinium_carterae.1
MDQFVGIGPTFPDKIRRPLCAPSGEKRRLCHRCPSFMVETPVSKDAASGDGQGWGEVLLAVHNPIR